MNLVLNGMFILTCYPILFVMYFMLRNAKNKNNWCFGATLSRELKNDPAVEAIDVEYRKNLKNSMIVLGVIPIVNFFIPYFSIVFTIWTMWILVICFLPMFWYAKANKQIQELKQERGWNQVSEASYTDLKIASVPRRVKLTTFLPTLILSTIPIIIAFIVFQGKGYAAYGWIVVTFALCTYLFYASAIWTDRQKITVISEDSDTNMNFARAKKQVWKNYWLACAWVNTVFTWFILLFMFYRHMATAGIIWGSIIYCVVVVVISILLVKKLVDINNRYEPKRTIADASDDDGHWPYGLMYYNKNDKHIMVENRMGTGTALNMATGIGMGTNIFSGLVILSLPIICIWVIMLEFTPIQTTVVDKTIVCQHLSVEYEIPLEDIEEYTVITDLPEMTKMNGNGMDNVLSGTYEIYREGTYEVFLNPQNDLFIKIVTDDEMYYISGIDDGETQQIIDVIEESVD